LLFERFQQRRDRLLSLAQIAFGGFGEFGEGLIGEPEELGLILSERLGAQGLEGLAEIAQRLGLERTVFGELLIVELAFAGKELFGGGASPVRGGFGGVKLDLLPPKLDQGGIAGGQLITQFDEEWVGSL
jgi:hypothetical protein